MSKAPQVTAALVVAFVLSGCAAGGGPSQAVPADIIADASARVAAAHWSKAEIVSVSLTNFRFTPERLEFRQNQPYILQLANQSGSSHTFSSDGFFKAIAVKMLEADTATPVPSSVSTVELAPGEEKVLYFVAVGPGAYELHCSEFFHDKLGMTGRITIK